MVGPFDKGHRLTVAEMTEIARGVAQILTLTGDGLIEVAQTRDGKTLRFNVEALLPRIPKVRWGFWGRLTAEAAGGGGDYSWKRLQDDAKTDALPAHTGTDNAKEVGKTEGLKVGEEDGTVVWLWPDTTSDPAEWRFAYEKESGTAETPAVILPSAFEQETIAEDTWDRDTPPANTDGVRVRVQMRTAYNDAAGTPTLFAFYREFLYDSRGNLKSISAETRISVDVTEPC